MRRILALVFISGFVFGVLQANTLAGYHYGLMAHPSGDEWNNPENIAFNKEQPRAWFFSFDNMENARKVLPEYSCYWKSLNGKWKFNWVPVPEERPVGFECPEYDVSKWDDVDVPMNWNVYGIQKDGTQKYGTPIYVNVNVPFWHEVKVDDWRQGVMRTPPSDWTMFKCRNEVGSYRRTFTIPENWKNMDIHICFDGVDSFFYLWINGRYVGFSKNSRNAARFDITDYLHKGENILAVAVYRNSDGSQLEAQDMFRLPGIFRTVALEATPQVCIQNLRVVTDADDYEDCNVKIMPTILNNSKKEISNYSITYSLFLNNLYSDTNAPAKQWIIDTQKISRLKDQSSYTKEIIGNIDDPKFWSAETPWRYTLVAQLKDNKGRIVHTVSTYMGARKAEILPFEKNMDEYDLGGNFFCVNLQPVKLKGVNRHETNPETGHVVGREQMMEEVKLMKRANINCVRTSHYPDDPYWYYLCDKYGLYVVSEANNEAHQYAYKEASLSHPAEWKNAIVDRTLEMAYAYYNNPSIIMWSLGNESGPGKNFQAAYDALRELDSSRPIHYERNNDISDVGSCMYPSVERVENIAGKKGDFKYPYYFCEYAHSMGQAVGNLEDYWKIIESNNNIMGGCIWDWVDQGIYNYDSTSNTRYIGYGGDFGDVPNDGQFVMNGIMLSDLRPKPQYYEVKHVYQNIEVKSIDASQGYFSVFNKNFFTSLSSYILHWTLLEEGKPIEEGDMNLPLIPKRKIITIKVPYNHSACKEGLRYDVNFKFSQNEDMPWAEKGYVSADEQLTIQNGTQRNLTDYVGSSAEKLNIVTENAKNTIIITGKNFCVKFNKKFGVINHLKYNDTDIIPDGNNIRIDAYRAFVNNDKWCYKKWFENGLHKLRNKIANFSTSANSDGSFSLNFEINAKSNYKTGIEGKINDASHKLTIDKSVRSSQDDFKFKIHATWTVYPNGAIILNSTFDSNMHDFDLGRIGWVLPVNKLLDNITYYGRGPADNYPDRKASQFTGIYNSNLKDMIQPFCKPQDMGNREEVKWCLVSDKQGNGARFTCQDSMSIEYLPYTDMEIIAASHPHKLKEADLNYLHLDAAVTGLGGASCGPQTLDRDKVKAGKHKMSILIQPLD